LEAEDHLLRVAVTGGQLVGDGAVVVQFDVDQ
jgi:hypothetical protein